MIQAMPSERNQAIFRAVRIAGRSLREVATDFEISVARVTEICKQVEQWYKVTLGDWLREQSPEERLVLTCRLHLERLDELFHQAAQAWEASTRTTYTESKKDDGEVVRKPRPQFGQPRYSAMAMRVMREQLHVCALMNKIPPEIYDRIMGGPRPEQVAAYQAYHEALFANDPESVDEEPMLEGTSTRNEPSEPPVSVCAREAEVTETYDATEALSPVVSPSTSMLLDEATMEEIFASSLENANSAPVRLSRARRKERAKLKKAAERRSAQGRGKGKAKPK
jgi:hypothetical protein